MKYKKISHNIQFIQFKARDGIITWRCNMHGSLKWQSPKSCQRVPIMIVNRFIVLCVHYLPGLDQQRTRHYTDLKYVTWVSFSPLSLCNLTTRYGGISFNTLCVHLLISIQLHVLKYMAHDTIWSTDTIVLYIYLYVWSKLKTRVFVTIYLFLIIIRFSFQPSCFGQLRHFSCA